MRASSSFKHVLTMLIVSALVLISMDRAALRSAAAEQEPAAQDADGQDKINVEFSYYDPTSGLLSGGGGSLTTIKIRLIPERAVGAETSPGAGYFDRATLASLCSPEGVFYWNPFLNPGSLSNWTARHGFVTQDLGIDELLQDKDIAAILGPDRIANWETTLLLFVDPTGQAHATRAGEQVSFGGGSRGGWTTKPGSGDIIGVQFTVGMNTRPTEEQVQSITRGLIKFLELGVRQRALASLDTAAARFKKQLEEVQSNQATLEKQQQELKDILKGDSPMSESTVNELHAEFKLLDIEYVGVKATIEKCQEILETRRKVFDLSPEGQQLTNKIEGMKLEAEVQLASLAARKERFQEMLDKESVYAQLQSVSKDLASLLGNATYLNSALQEIEEQRAIFSPLRLYNNTVDVRTLVKDDGE